MALATDEQTPCVVATYFYDAPYGAFLRRRSTFFQLISSVFECLITSAAANILITLASHRSVSLKKFLPRFHVMRGIVVNRRACWPQCRADAVRWRTVIDERIWTAV